MQVDVIVKIAISITSFVIATLIPTVIALVKAIKSKKIAKTEKEKAETESKMRAVVNEFIAEAEELYKYVDAAVKVKGGTCGAVKKDSVLTKLQAYAINNGYIFDKEHWAEVIDEIVAMTRQVNAK